MGQLRQPSDDVFLEPRRGKVGTAKIDRAGGLRCSRRRVWSLTGTEQLARYAVGA
jgi:hypothetical protein